MWYEWFQAIDSPADQTQQTVDESLKDNNKWMRGLHGPENTQQSIKQQLHVQKKCNQLKHA